MNILEFTVHVHEDVNDAYGHEDYFYINNRNGQLQNLGVMYPVHCMRHAD